MTPWNQEAREEEAAVWAARLDGGTLNEAQQHDLQAWLQADPRHRDLLAGYCQLSADLEWALPAVLSSEAERPQLSAPEPVPASRSVVRFVLPWVIAGAMAAAAAVVVLTRPVAAPVQSEIAVANGMRETVILADGSKVLADAGTRMAVAQDRHSRRVALTHGQAFFSVAKEPERPFLVQTQAGEVRVTGTRFAVEVFGESDVRVLVEEGSVEMTAKASGARVCLSKGDGVRTEGLAVRRETLSAEAVEDALAWRQGQVVFADEPLARAVARLARHHGKTVQVDPTVAGLRVGGRYSLDDWEGFLATLAELFPVQVVRTAEGAEVKARSLP